MYELFILSELFEEPSDGYKLRSILQKIVGNERKISFGVIYPQLERMENKGFIDVELVNTDSKRPKKVNHITELGKARFTELMGASVPLNQNAQLTYEIKIGSFHTISSELQLQVMEDYMQYLNNKIQINQDNIAEIKQKPTMSIGDKSDTVEIIELRQVQNQAALKWAQQKINQMR
ncbi:PadR family transcriptional regulator [Pediococcus argentinicus]|uniref:Transcription regulator PadR N-terminal domain-containing protein n=1 Tax=Pediococcus argentinicus TaxID=480391 RepID=A0A0R2NKF4_9LACO|nr:PadR family transcriptional regulator [Pediococcus argentinicus]KRO25330.1 hypothetical protein IV88_GL000275 [Pediococcus argentinicus]NKZ22069.1 PadR family transcriptional regulator [Pediococcus argentinicus]GEP19408.1 PadR family transcriptional regulator [Pediococcus argentinicus]